MNPALIAALEEAGFRIYNTGGGCTAWMNESGPDGHYILITDDNLSHEIEGDVAEIGLYDSEGDCIMLVQGKITDYLKGKQ